MQCRWQVEVDPFCQDILAKHWFGVKRYGDIRQLTGTELEAVDVVCGGFPCQDLSVAGKRTGIEGSRSGLWFEYARLLGVLRPQFVLIENVSGLLVHDAMRRVVGELARLGYVGIWRSFRASDFGASHLRKRIFIVAHSQSRRRGELRERRDGVGPTGPDVLPNASGERLPDAQQEGVLGAGRREEGRTATELCGAFAPGPNDPRWPSILTERPDLAPSLESPVRGMAHGFPDWLDRAMSNRTKRLSRLGNAVVPEIAEWIGQRISLCLSAEQSEERTQ
jgi:site-specific DNA-cytosine methylase